MPSLDSWGLDSQAVPLIRCNLITKVRKVLAYCNNPPDALLLRDEGRRNFSILLRRSVTFAERLARISGANRV